MFCFLFIRYLLENYFSKEKWMGMGDAYLALLAGLAVGWPKILLALTLAFTTGAICGIILIALKKKTMKSQVPFAPFLIIGIALTIFLEKSLASTAYWRYIF